MRLSNKTKRGAARLPFLFFEICDSSSLSRLFCDAGDGVSRCGAGGGDGHAKKPRWNSAAARDSLKFVAWIVPSVIAANLLRTTAPEKSPAPR
jgi:hypothetical protein